MFRNIALALSAAAVVAVPTVADAHGRYYGGRGYSNYGYAQGYAYPSYGYSQSYGYPAYGYSQSYGYPAYGYGQSSYGYNGYNGYNNGYCRNNAGTGVAIGGVTGAVIGSSVSGGHRYSNEMASSTSSLAARRAG